MTFRPSDDVIDEKLGDQQSFMDQNSVGNQENGQNMFKNSETFFSNGEAEDSEFNQNMINIPVDEVKAPDISELLKNTGGNDVENDVKVADEGSTDVDVKNSESSVDEINNSEKKENSTDEKSVLETKTEEKVENKQVQNEENKLEKDEELDLDSSKITDAERSAIISGMEGSINSNLDFLIDNDWFSVVNRYKRLNRLVFRWGFFVLAVVIGAVFGVLFQTKISSADNVEMIKESSIENMVKRRDDMPDKILSPLIESGVEFDVGIPYGVATVSGTIINSKSNLILYKGVVLPQLSVIDYNSGNFISLGDFNEKKLTRADIVNFINSLVANDNIYRSTVDIPSALDLRWESNDFGGPLEKKFNLSCLQNAKISDYVCDRFLEIFYKYGKYYDLSQASSDLLKIVKTLRKNKEDIEPICNMVKEYTLHAGNTAASLMSVMEYCEQDELEYYRKLVNFIDLENSLGQPELSSRVFDDPDLNAYKLLSAWQTVYKILEGTSLNEGYIKSYLAFVQSLLDRDKGTNRYLSPIYKDLLYVFNMDELYQKLMKKGKLSSDIKLQIDQINNGNSFGSISLLSQLTTADIVQNESDFTGVIIGEKTLEDLFSQYYAMNDRLKIRKAEVIDDNIIKVQTEIFTNGNTNVTNGETLKVTTSLRREDNLLYVESIKVANQPKFTNILNIYLSGGDITFYAMLNYIDEQVGMWYESNTEEIEEQPTFCEKIMEREDIAVYTCDDTGISLYKGDVEYNFVLVDGILDSFTISDKELEQLIKSKLDGVLFMRDSTPSMITSIIDFEVEVEDGNLEKKLEIIDQFRIHFKMVPEDIRDIEGKSDLFLIDFTLGDFKLQGYYNINNQTLTKISYVDCKKPLEIRGLSIEITSENEPQLLEILNNPRVFFATVSPSIYKKYQKVCLGKSDGL